MSKGTLFVITGPSGVGKGTVLKKVFEAVDGIYFSVSATTRKPRIGEIDGESYSFVTREAFKHMISAGELLEYAEYVGNFYGTPEKAVNEMLEQGSDVILEIELQGALNIIKKRPDAVTVFIAPPSFSELEARLRDRGTESEESVCARLETAKHECNHASMFQYIVINDKLDTAAQELSAIILATRCVGAKRLHFLNN